MEAAEIIKGLRDKTGMTRKAFSDHLGIPVRTKYEELIKKLGKEDIEE